MHKVIFGVFKANYPSLYTKRENHILDILKKIEATYPNFYVFPIHEFLCDSSKCPSHMNGIRLYRDNLGHISIYAAKDYLSAEIRNFILDRDLLKK